MEDKGTPRQVRRAALVGLLAPMAGLPAVTARLGGALGWLSPLIAIPGAVLALFALRRLGPEGLGTSLVRLWGPVGRGVKGLFYLWAMALAAMTSGLAVDRLGRTDYGSLSPWLLSLALTAAAWYLTRKGPGAFLRAAWLFAPALLGVLILFLTLGARDLDWSALRPKGAELAGALRGAGPALGTLATGTLAALLPRTEGEGKGLWAPVGWCGAAALLCLLVTGALGPRLTGELPLPFFLSLQSIGVPGGFQRLEGLATAVWALSDVTLMGLAALAGGELTGGKRGSWPVLLAALAGGGLLTAETLRRAGQVLWTGALLLGGGVPLSLALTQKIRGGKKEGGGISCG